MPIWDWIANALGRTEAFGLAIVFGILMIALIQVWVHVMQQLSPERPTLPPIRQGLLDFGLAVGLVVLATGLFTAGIVVLKHFP